MITRRHFIAGIGAGIAAPTFAGLGLAQVAPVALVMPPMLDATKTGRFTLTAQAGSRNFLGRSATDTWGFNQSYLGPTLRLDSSSEVQAQVENSLNEPISVHWHGLLVPGDVDGGPHQTIRAGGIWNPVMQINQPAATLWYHSHIHGETGRHVQNGLAGVLQISDGLDHQRGLPVGYGVDDLVLVLQDRNFDRRGRASYNLDMHAQMMGFSGDTLLVNGQVNAVAPIAKGLVRLRLLNGSNARVYDLAMSDGRPMHLIASDAGLLDQPVVLRNMTLAPGERAEVLVNFSNGIDAALVSGPNPNVPMMGGGMMGGATDNGMIIMPFVVDNATAAPISEIPQTLGGSVPQILHDGLMHREFTLNMAMGMGMMARVFGSAGNFSINDKTYDMARMDFAVKLGSTERWTVQGEMMMHPFHVHGVSFQVLSENGGPPRLQNRGWKDTILVNGQVELLMRFDHPASADLPYMYHCHILEHEDGGMMGQFTVG